MKNTSKILSLLLLLGILTLQGCFTASSQLENIKATLLNKNDGGFDNYCDTDILPDSDSNNDDEFNFSIGPVGLFFTYGLVYLLSPFDEVDFDMAMDVLNNIDGLAISTSSFASSKELPDGAAIKKIKSELYSDGYEPLVLNREKNEINLIFISNDLHDDGGKILIINFSSSEMNLVAVKANFMKVIKIALKYNKVNLQNYRYINPLEKKN